MNFVTGPSVNRHRSKQDYETPPDFMEALTKRFGSMSWDLAATPENAKAPSYYTKEVNSLFQDWTTLRGNLFLNPPFSDIAPWARKCNESITSYTIIFLLVPASIDSNWYAEHVHNKSLVLALSPRLSFDRCNPYPKPMILAIYGTIPDFKLWRWKQ